MGQSPGASLPLLSYKSELLTTKAEDWHHFLSESSHPLQGDKQEINIIAGAVRQMAKQGARGWYTQSREKQLVLEVVRSKSGRLY